MSFISISQISSKHIEDPRPTKMPRSHPASTIACRQLFPPLPGNFTKQKKIQLGNPLEDLFAFGQVTACLQANDLAGAQLAVGSIQNGLMKSHAEQQCTEYKIKQIMKKIPPPSSEELHPPAELVEDYRHLELINKALSVTDFETADAELGKIHDEWVQKFAQEKIQDARKASVLSKQSDY